MRRRRCRGVRRRPPALALLALVLSASCSCSEPSLKLERLIRDESVVVTSSPVVLGPDHRWQVDGPRWTFNAFATLWLFVSGERTAPLVVRFEPAGKTARQSFEARWDGRPATLDSDPEAGTFAITIAAERAGAGVHSLELRQTPARGASLFSEVSVDGVAAAWAMTPGRAKELARLGEFLEKGGTGLEKAKRRGLLVAGGAATELAYRFDGERTLFAVAQNLTPAPAELVVEAGGERWRRALAGEGEEDLTLRLPSGRGRLRVHVEGAEPALVLLGAPALVEALASSTRKQPSPRPPVVLVTLDTTRRDALGVYGAPADRTPNLDRFASAADVYDAAYSTAPWTLPSHASMFTGLYPHQHLAGVRGSGLAREIPTLATRLHAAGYEVAGFAGGDLVAYRFGVGRGFDRYRDPDGFETHGEDLTRYILDFLDHRRQQPLFLFANYFDAHWRYEPPPEFAERFELDRLARDLAGEAVWDRAFAGDSQAWWTIAAAEVDLSPAAQRYLEAAYHAEVSAMDGYLGRLFRALAEHGLYDDALVILVADHGEALGEDGRFIGHGFRLGDELVHVPLIVKWPHQTEGRRVAELTSVVDLYPSVLTVAGLEPPAKASASRFGALDLRALPRVSPILSEEHSTNMHPLVGARLLAKHLYRVQTPAFRQIVWDAGEDCAGLAGKQWHTEPCRQPSRDLFESFSALLQAAGDGSDLAEVDARTGDALRALGYL